MFCRIVWANADKRPADGKMADVALNYAIIIAIIIGFTDYLNCNVWIIYGFTTSLNNSTKCKGQTATCTEGEAFSHS